MELNKRKVEGAVWAVERWISFVILGSLLMVVAGLLEKNLSDFPPWDFMAGGIWIGYCNWRRGIKG